MKNHLNFLKNNKITHNDTHYVELLDIEHILLKIKKFITSLIFIFVIIIMSFGFGSIFFYLKYKNLDKKYYNEIVLNNKLMQKNDSLNILIFNLSSHKTNIKNIEITTYNATTSQCDSTPLITANGSFIDTTKVLRWCAPSRDLFYNFLNLGDNIYIQCANKDYEGWYKVVDMKNDSTKYGRLLRRSVDILLTPKDKRRHVSIPGCVITKIIKK